MLAELGVGMQKMPSEVMQFTRSQALLYYRMMHARQADQLHALTETILAGIAPTAGEKGAALYEAVRAYWATTAATWLHDRG